MEEMPQAPPLCPQVGMGPQGFHYPLELGVVLPLCSLPECFPAEQQRAQLKNL